MSGKHADSRPAPRGFSTQIANIAQFLPRRYVPLIASLTLAGVVLGASVAAMSLGPATDAPPKPSAAGSDESITLPADVKRYVAVRAVDDQGNVARIAVVRR